jgi:nucleoside-diphosphate-sugar epimerase
MLQTSYAHDISEELPIRPGLGIYALSKGCGSEICRVFSENYPITVMTCLFFGFVGTWAGSGNLREWPRTRLAAAVSRSLAAVTVIGVAVECSVSACCARAVLSSVHCDLL